MNKMKSLTLSSLSSRPCCLRLWVCLEWFRFGFRVGGVNGTPAEPATGSVEKPFNGGFVDLNS